MIKEDSDILLVEDSDDDYLFVKKAFAKTKLKNNLIRVADGEEALVYLKNQETALPSLVLLDINLPKVSGITVLEEMRNNPMLQKIPVIMLTTSDSQEDIDKCYSLGANSYICKPVKFDGFIEALNRIKGFWFEIVLYPK